MPIGETSLSIPDDFQRAFDQLAVDYSPEVRDAVVERAKIYKRWWTARDKILSFKYPNEKPCSNVDRDCCGLAWDTFIPYENEPLESTVKRLQGGNAYLAALAEVREGAVARLEKTQGSLPEQPAGYTEEKASIGNPADNPHYRYWKAHTDFLSEVDREMRLCDESDWYLSKLPSQPQKKPNAPDNVIGNWADVGGANAKVLWHDLGKLPSQTFQPRQGMDTGTPVKK